MKNVVYFTCCQINQINFDWLKLALSSLKRHCSATAIVVVDDMSKMQRDIIKSKYKVEIKRIEPSRWNGRRTLCRLELTNEIVKSLKSGEVQLIQSDIDVLFLDNPFKAFDEQEFGIGVTKRMYSYHVPVNSGLVFFRITDFLKDYTHWAVEQAKNPTWWPYLMTRSSRDNLDWGCDQDIVNAIFKYDGMICSMFGGQIRLDWFGLFVKDIGYKYNYCAGTDVLGFGPAIHLMKRALTMKKYTVLHFKGERLKQLIYESCLEKYR